jgi:hypothetical protein
LGSTITDTEGNYSYTGLGNGTYVVIPSLAGFAFNPTTSGEIVISNGDATANFTITFSISGYVSASAGSAYRYVTISLYNTTTGQTTTATTGLSGEYAFTGLTSGTFNVTPSFTDTIFTPTTRAVTITNVNQTGVDFTSSITAEETYTISGIVKDSDGLAKSGVTMTLSQGSTAVGTVTSDASGNYNFPGLSNGAYTLTPSLSGFNFTPTSIPLAVSNSDITGVNFTAVPVAIPVHNISGNVSLSTTGTGLAGVTMTLSGAASETTITDSSGNYTFTGLPDGNYTITPTLSPYNFNSTSGSNNVTVSGADITKFNFKASIYRIDGLVYLWSENPPYTPLGGVTLTLRYKNTSQVVATTTSITWLPNFYFTNLSNGTYTITPVLSGYTFSPASQDAVIDNASNPNFVMFFAIPN